MRALALSSRRALAGGAASVPNSPGLAGRNVATARCLITLSAGDARPLFGVRIVRWLPWGHGNLAGCWFFGRQWKIVYELERGPGEGSSGPS